jgi:hypothetical protein
MVKRLPACLFVILAAGVCLATAQNSPGHSSSKSDSDSLKAATKPLTPKSAMQNPRKSSLPTPGTQSNGPNSSAELDHLERQDIKASAPKKPRATAPKPAGTSNGSGSGINFTYQKPVTKN